MRKSLHFQQGTRSRVVPKKITPEIVTDARFLMLSVFEIERCWAYAMFLKSEAATDPRKRYHMISRLRKAASQARYLAELVQQVPACDAQANLELKAYIQWICGVLCFELRDWMKAKELLEASQNIYSGLAVTVDDELKGTYSARANELLPQIRYCAYNSGDKSAESDLRQLRSVAVEGSDVLAEDQLDELLRQVQATQAVSVTDVSWLGVTIPVKLEKARMAVLAVQEAATELEKCTTQQAKLAVYESILKTLVEGVASAREELRTLTPAENLSAAVKSKASQSSAGGEKLARTQRLYGYLQFLKLQKTIDRNLLHIEAAISGVPPEGRHADSIVTSSYHKPQELARLYDTLVQNLQEIVSLPGDIQERADVKAMLQAKVVAYKSFRCYYLALAYLHGEKFMESSTLLERCQVHANTSLQEFDDCDLSVETESAAVPGHTCAILKKQLGALIRQADAEVLTCKAGRMLELAGGDTEETHISASEQKEPLVNRLEEYLPEKVMEKKLLNNSAPLVPFPPAFEPVPAKPIFFDLALNHISFPSSSSNVNGSGALSSITGLMRGFLWGSGETSKK